jgi:muramidase (phage lysozyme)
VTPNTATINIGNLLSQTLMSFISSAEAAPQTTTQAANLAVAQADLSQPNVKAFLETIAAAEGGNYNVINTGIPVNNLMHFPAPTIYGSAAGEYQILAPTYALLSAQLGLTDWSPQTQDLMAAFILQKIGVVADLQAGNLPAAITAASNQWSAVPMGSGTLDHSRYTYATGPHAGQYQPSTDYQAFINMYHANGGQ